MKRVYRTSRRTMKRKPDKKGPVRRRKSRPKRSNSKRSKSMRSSVTYRSVRRRKTKSMKSVSKGGLSFTKKKKGLKGGYPAEDPITILESINHTDSNESPEQIAASINENMHRNRKYMFTVATLQAGSDSYEVVCDVNHNTPKHLLDFLNKRLGSNYKKILYMGKDYTDSDKPIYTSIGSSSITVLNKFKVK